MRSRGSSGERPASGPDQEALDQEAERPHHERADEQRRPEAARALHDEDARVGADHEEVAVGEVHDAEHAEDDRQAEGQHHEHGAERHAREQLHRDQFEVEGGEGVEGSHGRILLVGVRSGTVAEFVAGAQRGLGARLDLQDAEQVRLALHLGLLASIP